MSQAPMTVEQWKNLHDASVARSAALAVEAQALEAESANIAARKKLAAAKAPVDPDEAAASKSKAELADLKATLGAIPASGIEGKVDLADKAGQMESALLATKAMSSAANYIASAVKQIAPPPTAIFVFPSGEVPDLKALRAFRTFAKVLSPELLNAQRALDAATSVLEFAVVATVGVALEAASKLLGYLRSDYTVGGIELSADHHALAELVAGRLRVALPGTSVYLQTLYGGHEPALASAFIDAELTPLSAMRHAGFEKLSAATAMLATQAAQIAALAADAAADQEKLGGLRRRAARIEAAADRLKRVIEVHDAAMDKLVTDNLLETLIRQYELGAKLDDGQAQVLVAKLHKAGGSHYVEKNLWNLFGVLPFKVMGGVIVSYSLFDAKSGKLLLSDTLPVHGGFESAGKLGALLGLPD